MKRLFVAFLLITSVALAITQEEIEAAQAQAQALIKQSSSQNNTPLMPQANSGESIFQGKAGRDSTIQDWTNSSIRINSNQKGTSSYDNANYQNYSQVAQNMGELDENQLALLKSAMRNKNLRAVQQKFLRKNYKGTENTKNLNFETHKTQKITTRFAMATTLIFKQPIDSYIVGDSTGFQVEELPNMKNALAIKPLLIGIDTSLTVFTKDKKLHTFFIYSTDYKSAKDPDLVVYINEEEVPKGVTIYDEREEKLAKDYFIIKEGISEVRVKKSEIYDEYVQKALEKNEWLMAEEIFNDKKFTYFKYDKDKLPQIPTVFVVVDNQDSPQESRVIGNYLIVETIAEKFTLRIGDSYVCVEKINLKNANKYLTKDELVKFGKQKKIEKSYPKKQVKTKTRTLNDISYSNQEYQKCVNELDYEERNNDIYTFQKCAGNFWDYYKGNFKTNVKKTSSSINKTKAKQ